MHLTFTVCICSKPFSYFLSCYYFRCITHLLHGVLKAEFIYQGMCKQLLHQHYLFLHCILLFYVYIMNQSLIITSLSLLPVAHISIITMSLLNRVYNLQHYGIIREAAEWEEGCMVVQTEEKKRKENEKRKEWLRRKEKMREWEERGGAREAVERGGKEGNEQHDCGCWCKSPSG